MPRWTDEAKRRQAEAIKGWKPWNHSTGATSDHGQRCAAANAYKHGLRSQEGRALFKLMRKQERWRKSIERGSP